MTPSPRTTRTIRRMLSSLANGGTRGPRRLRARFASSTLLVAVLMAGSAGCSLSLRDAVAAGVYDAVSAAVSEALSLFSPVSLLTAVYEAGDGGSQRAD